MTQSSLDDALLRRRMASVEFKTAERLDIPPAGWPSVDEVVLGPVFS